ncbi:unnamed protein product, partial [Prorocentrum cordatum]
MARRAAVLLEGRVHVANARGMGAQIAAGSLKYTDAAHMALHCLQIDPNETRTMTAPKLKNQIKRMLAERHADQLGGPAGGDKMPMTLPPAVFTYFCDVTTAFQEVKDAFADCRPPRAYARQAAAHGGAASAAGMALVAPPAGAAAAGGPIVAAGPGISYDGLTHAELLERLHARDATIAARDQTAAAQRATLRDLTRNRDQWQQRAALLADQLAERNQEEQVLMQAVRFRSGGRANVSLFGGCTLALRRNVAHAGGAATAAMVAGDELHGAVKDKRTVWTYEHRAAAAVRARALVAMGGQ